MTILERLEIIEQLAELNVTCKPNLADIKHHVAVIRKEFENGTAIDYNVMKCSNCAYLHKYCTYCDDYDLFTPKTASHG